MFTNKTSFAKSKVFHRLCCSLYFVEKMNEKWVAIHKTICTFNTR